MDTGPHARFLFVGLVAGLAGCSLLTTFDGYSGAGAVAGDGAPTTTDSGPTAADGSTSPDAPVGATDGAPTSTSTYADTVLADGPVAYYRLDEPNGKTALDSTGNGHSGTFGGNPTRGAPGAVGDGDTATTFDGSAVRLVLGDVFANTGTTAFSLELWARPATIDGSSRWLVQRNTTMGQPEGYDLYFGSTFLLFSRTANGVEEGYASGAAPTAGAWQHVVATYDGTTSTLYRDGASLASHSSPGAIGAGVGLLVLGDLARGQFFKYQGDLDEVAIYDKALAPERVLAHYKASGR